MLRKPLEVVQKRICCFIAFFGAHILDERHSVVNGKKNDIAAIEKKARLPEIHA